VYAPVSASTREFEFKPAAEMVVDSFRRFDDQFADLALKVFREERIDSEVRKGKRSGAFCATINPQLAPWVMVNFQGRSDDVATLAHELGHAIHSLMASHHSIFTQHACLPLAETASTFAEIMLVDRLLEEVTDASVRRDLLFRQVDDAYATIMRQTFFALFEKTAHEMTREGASVDELSGAYMENLHAQFGDTVEIGDEFRWEWVSIPHIFHTPFYVYAYAFGQLLVLSLYSQYRQEGDSFKPRYKEILSSGGSRPPIEILSGAGIDVRQAAFWQGGFDLISGLISQLETLDG
jgi:oligoendopeptidase F